MAPASALVAVTVLPAAGGMINRSGDTVADGMTMSLQCGRGTAGTDCVGFGVAGSHALACTSCRQRSHGDPDEHGLQDRARVSPPYRR